MSSKHLKKKKASIKYEARNSDADRNKEELGKFSEFQVLCKTPNTAILLLSSIEESIISIALQFIDKYATKQTDNIKFLKELGLVEKILTNELYLNADLYIRRFALKLLGLTFEFNEILDDSLTNKLYDTVKYNYTSNDEDNFIVEYSALILLSFLKEPRLSIAIGEDQNFFLDGILKHITMTKDSNILYNSYQILQKIISSSLDIFWLKPEDIPFYKIIHDMGNQSKEIRELVSEVLIAFLKCKNDAYVIYFINEKFYGAILDTLENENFANTHGKSVELLQYLVVNEKAAEYFYTQNYINRFILYARKNKLQYIEAVKVLSQLANFTKSLDMLIELDFLQFLIEIIKEAKEITFDILLGFKRMLVHPEALIKALDKDLISVLVSLINDDNQTFEIQEISAATLLILCQKNKKACEIVLECNITAIVNKYLVRSLAELCSKNLLCELLNILMILSLYEDIRSKVIDINLAKNLYKILEKPLLSSSKLKFCALNTITAYAMDDVVQEVFMESSQFIQILLKFLKSNSILAKNAVIEFLITTSKIKKFSNRYVCDGILDFLISNNKTYSGCSNWSQAIQVILSTNLSIKFAINGRLEISDIIKHEFFISKQNWRDICFLRQIANAEVCPLYPVITVNLNLSNSSELNGDPAYEWIVYRQPCDQNLKLISRELHKVLKEKRLSCKGKDNNTIDVSQIEIKAKILAEFVCCRLSGICRDPTEICDEVSVKNHLNVLKCELHNNIIPLGCICYGSYFEKAVLFKVLADEIGLPCTLVRSIEGRILYNEIPVPVQENKINCTITNFPRTNLKPTHIVDLMHSPGELYPLETVKAFLYLQLS